MEAQTFTTAPQNGSQAQVVTASKTTARDKLRVLRQQLLQFDWKLVDTKQFMRNGSVAQHPSAKSNRRLHEQFVSERKQLMAKIIPLDRRLRMKARYLILTLPRGSRERSDQGDEEGESSDVAGDPGRFGHVIRTMDEYRGRAVLSKPTLLTKREQSNATLRR